MNGSYAYDSWGEIDTSQQVGLADVAVSNRNGVMVGEARMLVGGKGIPYRLVLPPGETQPNSLRGMLLLHGGGSSAKDFARFQGNAAALYQTATVALDFTDFGYDFETNTPLYGDWETRIFEIHEFVLSMKNHPLVNPAWVTTAGGSGGGATTLDYAMRYGLDDGLLACYPWYCAPPSWMRSELPEYNVQTWSEWPLGLPIMHLYGDLDNSGARWFMDGLAGLVEDYAPDAYANSLFGKYVDSSGAWGDHNHGYMTRNERLPVAMPYADTFMRTLSHFRAVCENLEITWTADMADGLLELPESRYRT